MRRRESGMRTDNTRTTSPSEMYYNQRMKPKKIYCVNIPENMTDEIKLFKQLHNHTDLEWLIRLIPHDWCRTRHDEPTLSRGVQVSWNPKDSPKICKVLMELNNSGSLEWAETIKYNKQSTNLSDTHAINKEIQYGLITIQSFS